MSDLLFGLALVWFFVFFVFVSGVVLRSPARAGELRPFPWLVQAALAAWLVLAALVALAALARFLGY